MATRTRALIAKPAIYVTWAGIVVAALAATYFADPYIFGFTAFGLAWLTAGVAVMGISGVLLGRTVQPRARMAIVMAVIAAFAAVAVALAVLSTFNWA